MRFKMTRESYIPKSAEEIKSDDGVTIAYLYTFGENGRVAAMGFGGKRQKPDFHYTFLSEQQARDHIAKYFEGQRQHQERKAKRRKERTAFRTSLQVGDILTSSWGYEQTNVDWYQVTEVKPSGKSIVIRQISSEVDQTGFMAGESRPVPDCFTGEPQLKHVQPNDYISISSYASASKWNGRPRYCSWYA